MKRIYHFKNFLLIENILLFLIIDSQYLLIIFMIFLSWPGNRTNPTPEWLRRVVSLGMRVHELFVVFIPTIIIIVANVMLLLTLKQRFLLFK